MILFLVRYSVAFIVLVLVPALLLADSTTVKVFPIDDFYAQILQHHPVARQAGLLSEKAKQEIRIARGMLDPQLNSKFYRKELGGSHYYTLWDNYLRIPVWYGTDITAGFERNSGINVNNENLTPSDGLSYIGITVPLGQGLIIDERRATIRQAELLGTLAEAERLSLINKLLLQAGKDYLDWLFAYRKYTFIEQAFTLADFRFNAVRKRIQEGDLSGIDSIEAKIAVQNLQVLMSQAQVEYQNASLLVSNHLWIKNNTPVEVTPDIVPTLTGEENTLALATSLSDLIGQAQRNHPDLRKIRVKLDQLHIERDFLADKLKPKLNLEYNILQKGFPLREEVLNGTFLSNNYKVGLSFSFPLFLRNERGKLQLNSLKLTEMDLDLQQSGREISNRIQASYNELVALNEQVRLQEQMVLNTELMRNGEQELFNNGESSLFLINSREMTLVNSRIKLAELQAKQAKAVLTLQWAAGDMGVE